MEDPRNRIPCEIFDFELVVIVDHEEGGVGGETTLSNEEKSSANGSKHTSVLTTRHPKWDTRIKRRRETRAHS
jgi:hypothetical protein